MRYPTRMGLENSSETNEYEERLYTCGAGKTSYHIDPYGKLLPCLIIQSHCMDLNGKDILSGWNGILKEFDSMMATDSFVCKKCTKRSLCPACPGLFALKDGEAEQVDDFFCQYTENRVRTATNQQV